MAGVFDENDDPIDASARARGQNEPDDIDLTHLSKELREVLFSTVTRVEGIEVERADLKTDQDDLIGAAKDKGLSPKMIRKVIARRKMDKAKREAEDSMLELYEGVFR